MASEEEGKTGEAVTVAKTPAELQRMRLEKLMKNPVSCMGFCNHELYTSLFLAFIYAWTEIVRTG